MGNECKKILVVDDEEMIRDLTREFLEAEGFQVVTASDGRKGVEMAKSQHPDLIIMDVNMPALTGFQALKEIKTDIKTMKIPVFMLSTRNSEEDIQAGMELYAEKYIPKPFTRDKLIFEVRQTLGLR